MANGRGHKKAKAASGRDSGGFIALPWSVVDSPAYAALSHPARSLLIEVARQFVRDNNGRLLTSRAHLIKRGWKSASVLQRAKAELIENEFIFETVKGHRPNKASWYAITWQILDRLSGFDWGVERAFRRGAYKEVVPAPKRSLRPKTNPGHQKTTVEEKTMPLSRPAEHEASS